jgi:hypothetical protein
MDTKYEALEDHPDRIVYVRPVKKSELPLEIQAHMGNQQTLYAICDESGERLALVKDRALAFAVARTNDFEPVSVH